MSIRVRTAGVTIANKQINKCLIDACNSYGTFTIVTKTTFIYVKSCVEKLNVKKMLEITLIQDLARKNLREVPKSVLDLTKLKMLYLEGNDLKQLPAELFILLDKLQWLDVRNNKLTTIPKTVMDHYCLETMLMQNNDIEILPVELGFVPNLKVLQLSGNPVIFPHKSIIEAGLPTITKFLRNEYVSREQHRVKEKSDLEFIKQSNSNETTTTGITDQSYIDKDYSSLHTEMPVITLKSFHKLQRTNSKKQKSRSKRMFYKSRSKYSIYKDTPNCNSNRYLNNLPVADNETRIQEQAVKDLFMRKMKDLLFGQDEILQRERDRDAMKKFRDNAKYRNKTPDRKYRPEVPYDYDNECDRMPSRKEINSFIERSTESVHSYKKEPKKINIEKLISDIVDSLKVLERERSIEKTPRAQMDYAGREIKRILDLQKRLSALKITNDSIL